MDPDKVPSNILAYAVGLPLGLIGVFSMSSSLSFGLSLTVVGVVLLMGFGFGGDAWLLRLPVAVTFAAVILAGASGTITGVFELSLLALAIAVVTGLLWWLLFGAEYAGIGLVLVFLIGCVIAAERVVAWGGGFWLAVLGVAGWILLSIVVFVTLAAAKMSPGDERRRSAEPPPPAG